MGEMKGGSDRLTQRNGRSPKADGMGWDGMGRARIGDGWTDRRAQKCVAVVSACLTFSLSAGQSGCPSRVTCKPARIDPKVPEANRAGVDVAVVSSKEAQQKPALGISISTDQQAAAPTAAPKSQPASPAAQGPAVRVGGSRLETPQLGQATAQSAPSIRNPLGYA
ncbi:hypothetical protein CPLU01_08172 [Colletotrichum plurivorum]|uniref:Uncharacterized protein n=1 Tax=Colletotrichum plurivorum TaxID=2175906 RepID=A0A8H6NDM9_9PEZI|nr:hypothetical protein CPLU01_08172 [Colletotrichum plurivorum]